MQIDFNAILKERTIMKIKNLVVTFTKVNLIRRLLTLFALILLHHIGLGWSSSSFPMLSLPLLGTDCLSFPLSGGLGPALAPLPHADPISLRPQATARFLIGHS
jgi:hypothetical protein